MINKALVAVCFLVLIIQLTGCITPRYQQSNLPIVSNTNAIEIAAEQFGQHLAKHILTHPNVADNIHCATIPLNNTLSTDGTKSINNLGDRQSEKQLCTLEVIEYEPKLITRMSFFTKSGDGDISVIDSFHAEGESTLGQIGFSENGKYFYLVKTDEGHPWFTFYDTQKFLTDYMHAQVGEVFEEYFLDHIEAFYDNGDIVFSLREDIITNCANNEMAVNSITANNKAAKGCLMRHNIFEQYNSLSSHKEKVSLPLECHTVPNKKEQLCLATTQSSLGPVDDVVFYHRNGDGNLTLIDTYRGDIAVLFFSQFSTNGKLLALGYAEEGHPSFYIHDTKKYLAGEKSEIGFISKYEYTHLEEVSDNGDITIGVMDCFIEDAPLGVDKNNVSKIDSSNDCTIKLNIYQTPEVH